MPFHSHHHSTSSASHQNAPSNPPGTASGIYQTAQTLGTIGAPTGNLRIATSGAIGPAVAESPYSSGAHSTTLSGGVHPPSASGVGISSPATGASMSAPVSAATSRPFEAPRRANTMTRQSEELHLHSSPMTPAQHGYHQQSPRTQHHSHQGSQDYTANTGPPHINFHQATPSNSSYSNPPSASNHPGSLQPGSSSRPLPLSSNTAPAAVPTIPQIQTQMQQYVIPPRPANLSHSHSYSRSSPSGGLDSQKYVPYPGTPETAKYPPQSNPKYTSTQSQQGALSNSPLGLADIRPRAGSGLSDGPTSAHPYSYDEESLLSTESNYQAPWPIYAFDWCKWPVHHYSGGSGGAGKVAVGSYLEDGHNYVSGHGWFLLSHLTLLPAAVLAEVPV